MFVRFGYLPKTFMQLVIIPLVKCESGDLSDVNNYRAISMYTAMSKLFEYVIAPIIQTKARFPLPKLTARINGPS